MKHAMLLVSAICLSATALAAKGDFGVEVDVTTAGLFPSTLETVVVASVQPDSSASKEGIEPGDKVVAIDGCAIPGCAAWQARKKMNKATGESAIFEVINENGLRRSVTLIAE